MKSADKRGERLGGAADDKERKRSRNRRTGASDFWQEAAPFRSL